MRRPIASKYIYTTVRSLVGEQRPCARCSVCKVRRVVVPNKTKEERDPPGETIKKPVFMAHWDAPESRREHGTCDDMHGTC